MIIIDTSVWIDHIRQPEVEVELLLKRDQALVHPFVIGEPALGNMKRHDEIINALLHMRQAAVAQTDDVLTIIKRHALSGSGIGYVDAHLLASAAMAAGTRIFTRDKRLAKVATALDLAYDG